MMNIMIVTSKQYVKYGLVMLESLYANNYGEPVTVYIVSAEALGEQAVCFKEQAKQYNNEVVFIEIQNEKLQEISFPNGVPRSALYKLLVADILPERVDRVLVLDVDIIIAKPIYELYYADFEDNVAMACEVLDELFDKTYFRTVKRENRHAGIPDAKHRLNSGVILYNMVKLRENKPTLQDIQAAFKEMDYCSFLPDEMLFNVMYGERVKRVKPTSYNLAVNAWSYFHDSEESEDASFGSILHFYGGNKPWKDFTLQNKCDLDEIWWQYAEKTPFYNELKEEFGTAYKNDLIKQNAGMNHYFNTLVCWKALSDENSNAIEKYLLEKGYQTVAVYGCNVMQDLLCRELQSSKQVDVKYLVDSYESGRKFHWDIKRASECTFEDVDAIVVTASFQYKSIKKGLTHTIKPVLALDDVIHELLPNDFYITGI